VTESKESRRLESPEPAIRANSHISAEPRFPSFVKYTVFAAVVLSVLSLLVNTRALYVAWSGGTYQDIDVSKLRYPSLYFGLDAAVGNRRWNKTSSAHAQQHVASPGSVRPVYRVSWEHPDTNLMEGYDASDVRVLVAEQVKSLITFTLDPVSDDRPAYQECILTGTFPARKDLASRLLTIEGDDGNVAKVEIYEVTSPLPAEFLQNPTYNTLGWVKKKPIDYPVKMDFGQNSTSEPFSCTPGQQTTIQIMCEDPTPCRLEYEFDYEDNPFVGFDIMPHYP